MLDKLGGEVDVLRDEAVARAPAHLRHATRKWFVSVVSAYVLKEHHIRLLTLAAESWDRCAEARERLAKEGLTVEGRSGLRPHPAVAIERDSRAAFAALIKQLGLDDVGDPRRGPGRPGSGGHGITWWQLQGLPEPAGAGKRQRRLK